MWILTILEKLQQHLKTQWYSVNVDSHLGVAVNLHWCTSPQKWRNEYLFSDFHKGNQKSHLKSNVNAAYIKIKSWNQRHQFAPQIGGGWWCRCACDMRVRDVTCVMLHRKVGSSQGLLPQQEEEEEGLAMEAAPWMAPCSAPHSVFSAPVFLEHWGTSLQYIYMGNIAQPPWDGVPAWNHRLVHVIFLHLRADSPW